MSQLQISSYSQSAPVFVGEVLEGELLDPGQHCSWCGSSDAHDSDYCCQCGHFHDGSFCRVSPCGDYRCCID